MKATTRSRRTTATVAVGVAVCALLVGCSASSDPPETTVAPATAPAGPGTLPGAEPSGSEALLIDDATGEVIGSGTTTTLAEVELISTVPPGPTTTIKNAGGPKRFLVSGDPVKDVVGETANLIYQAAIRRDYARLSSVIGDRRFRWGFIGQRGPAAQWQKDFLEGKSDEVMRIIALLETTPTIDNQGRTVWPYIAVKDPKEWTVDDEAVAASLGFQPENIAQTKLKGAYIDYQLVINPDGIWSGMYIG